MNPRKYPSVAHNTKTKKGSNYYTSTTTIPERQEQAPQDGIDIAAAVIIPPDLTHLHCHYCKRCKPYPPHDIVAHVTADDALTVHQTTCRAIRNRTGVIRVQWRPSTIRPGYTVLHIDTWDRVGLLNEITGVISTHNINMCFSKAETYVNGAVHFDISIQEKEPMIVKRIVRDIGRIRSVVTVDVSQPVPSNVSVPYISTLNGKLRNPYSPKPAHQGVFFGRREEIQTIWRSLEGCGDDARNSVFLWGQQRIGKTSLLNHLAARIHDIHNPQYVAISVTMMAWEHHSAAPPGELVLWFARQIHRSLEHSEHGSIPLPNLEQMKGHMHPGEVLLSYLDLLDHLLAPRKLLIMFDEFQRLHSIPSSQSEPLVDCLETIMTQGRNVSFLFAGWGLLSPHEQHLVLKRIFPFTLPIHVGVLDTEAARQLLCRPIVPLRYEESVIEQMLTLTVCHPFYIHLLCWDIVGRAMNEPHKQIITQDDLDQAVRRFLRSNGSSFYYLLEAVPDSDLVLNRLAQLASPPEHFVDFAMLMPYLTTDMTEHHAHQILQNLAELEIVEQPEHDIDTYRVRLPLFRQWLRRNPSYR